MGDDIHKKITYFRPGMTVEVLTAENKLLFLGKIDSVDDESIQIREAVGHPLPPVIFNTRLKVRGNSPGAQVALLYGSVCGSTDEFWRLDQLQEVYLPDCRASYRQRVDAIADLQLLDGPSAREGDPAEDPVLPCRLLDISLGGTLLWCQAPFQADDLLHLTKVRLLPGEADFTLSCRVRRVIEDPLGYRYGCEFTGLSRREEDRLFRSIFTLQRQEIQSKRAQSHTEE